MNHDRYLHELLGIDYLYLLLIVHIYFRHRYLACICKQLVQRYTRVLCIFYVW